MFIRIPRPSSAAWLVGLVLLFSSFVASPAIAQPPVLTVQEPELGEWVFQGIDDPHLELQVVEDDLLDFSWLAEPGQPDASILGYRYGWDLADPSDPDDPNWATELQPDLLSAPTQSFSTGVHSLHVEVQDDLGGVTRAWISMQIVPPVTVDATTWHALKALFR